MLKLLCNISTFTLNNLVDVQNENIKKKCTLLFEKKKK